jgi:phage shock protein C
MELTTETGQPDADARPLRRPVDGRMIAGVAAGAAEYFGIDVVIVRILFAVLALAGGIGVPLYVASWLLVPEEHSDESVAEHVLGRVQVEVASRREHEWSDRPFERSGDAL